LIISSWPALTADDARLGAVLVQRALPMAAQRESRVAADDKPTAVVKAGGWQPRAEVLGGILALAAEDGTSAPESAAAAAPARVASDGPSADEVTHREAPLQAVSCVERSVLGATRPLAMAGARRIAAPACERLWVSLIERADSPVVMGARERVPVPESGACSRVQMLLWTIDQLAH
jgi:hypothetical protein